MTLPSNWAYCCTWLSWCTDTNTLCEHAVVSTALGRRMVITFGSCAKRVEASLRLESRWNVAKHLQTLGLSITKQEWKSAKRISHLTVQWGYHSNASRGYPRWWVELVHMPAGNSGGLNCSRKSLKQWNEDEEAQTTTQNWFVADKVTVYQ